MALTAEERAAIMECDEDIAASDAGGGKPPGGDPPPGGTSPHACAPPSWAASGHTGGCNNAHTPHTHTTPSS
ncbi:hypothetical protein AB1Y20_016896 [Prymnesium parvum]|uniref:Uncharacterized protein n=1 Tax=Prymnesium parvum TaxID=97485 RepID=A0AB34IAB8_PRYPA